MGLGVDRGEGQQDGDECSQICLGNHFWVNFIIIILNSLCGVYTG